MLRPTDITAKAAESGITLDHAIAKEAYASVDYDALVSEQETHYTTVVWDGKSPCPFDSADRWLHGSDGVSRKAIANIAAGGVVYFLFRDDHLVAWQPYAAKGGHKLVTEPGSAHHVDNDIKNHISMHIEQFVDQEHYHAVLDAALMEHSKRGIATSR